MGGAAMVPIARRNLLAEKTRFAGAVGGEEEREFFFAFDRPVGRAEVAAGFPRTGESPTRSLDIQALPGPGELIVSGALARKHGIDVGERLPVGERQFTVSDTTGEGTGFRFFSFMNYE